MSKVGKASLPKEWTKQIITLETIYMSTKFSKYIFFNAAKVLFAGDKYFCVFDFARRCSQKSLSSFPNILKIAGIRISKMW